MEYNLNTNIIANTNLNNNQNFNNDFNLNSNHDFNVFYNPNINTNLNANINPILNSLYKLFEEKKTEDYDFNKQFIFRLLDVLTYIVNDIDYIKSNLNYLDGKIAILNNELQQERCNINLKVSHSDLDSRISQEHYLNFNTTQCLEDRIVKLERMNNHLIQLLEINKVLEEDALDNYENALNVNKEFESKEI